AGPLSPSCVSRYRIALPSGETETARAVCSAEKSPRPKGCFSAASARPAPNQKLSSNAASTAALHFLRSFPETLNGAVVGMVSSLRLRAKQHQAITHGPVRSSEGTYCAGRAENSSRAFDAVCAEATARCRRFKSSRSCASEAFGG